MEHTPHDTILLLEDDDSQARLIDVLLVALGLDVRRFASAEDLFKELPNLPTPRVALIDLALPQMSGIEVMKRFLLHPVWARVPVVVLTAYATEEWMQEARRLRVQPEAILGKPVSARLLQATLRQVMDAETPLLQLREAERRRCAVENEKRRADELKERQLNQIAVAIRETEGLLARCRSSMAGQRQMEAAARSLPKLQAEVDDRKRVIAEAIIFNENTLSALRDRRTEITEARRDAARRHLADMRDVDAEVSRAQQRLEILRSLDEATGTNG